MKSIDESISTGGERTPVIDSDHSQSSIDLRGKLRRWMDGEVWAGIAGTNGYWLRDDENHEMAQKEWTLYMLLVELRCAGRE
jgi:hypothetical protein